MPTNHSFVDSAGIELRLRIRADRKVVTSPRLRGRMRGKPTSIKLRLSEELSHCPVRRE